MTFKLTLCSTRKTAMQFSLDMAKAIYRKVIDPPACDGEGAACWEEVAEQVRGVVSARSLNEAAGIIDWWHYDWTLLSD